MTRDIHLSPDPRLNAAQLRRVKIVLRRFEEDLRRALRWLDGEREEGLLYQRSLVLSDDLKVQARKQITKGLAEIQEMVRRLSLDQEVENASRSLTSQLSVDWADLIDIQSSRLSVFGTVDPELPAMLDEPVGQMAQIALDLSNLFMRAPADPTAEINPTDSQEKKYDNHH